MRQPFAMFKFFPVVIYICIFKVRASDQIYNIEDEDDEIKAKFDEYTLVSEDQRPSTICPVSFIVLRSFHPYIIHVYIIHQNATEVEEIRLIDGKKYSKLTIIDVSHEYAFFDTTSGISYIRHLR